MLKIKLNFFSHLENKISFNLNEYFYIMTMHLKIFIHNYDAMNSKSSLLTCTFLVKITFTRKSKLQKKISKAMGRGLSIQLIRHLKQWSKQKIIQTFSTDYGSLSQLDEQENISRAFKIPG